MAKPLVFYVELDVKPNWIERFVEEASKVLETMSHEETFIDTCFHRNVNEPNKFTLYERWNEPSMDAFVQNKLEARAYRAEYEKILPDMLANPGTFTLLDSIGEWKRQNTFRRFYWGFPMDMQQKLQQLLGEQEMTEVMYKFARALDRVDGALMNSTYW